LIWLRLVFFRGAFDGPLRIAEVYTTAGVLYFGLFMAMQITTFGVSYGNGATRANVFDRTLAMSTAKLVTIKLSVAIISLLVAGLTMVAVIWIIGPLLIYSFDEISAITLEGISRFGSESTVFIISRVILFLVAFASGSIIYAAFNSWAMLKPRQFSWVFGAIPLYCFLIIVLATLMRDEGERQVFLIAVASGHSWLLVALLPMAAIYLFRAVLEDQVLNWKQLLIVSAVSVVLAALYISSLVSSGYYSSATHAGLVALVSLLGLLPFVAVGLALWTMSRIRHG